MRYNSCTSSCQMKNTFIFVFLNVSIENKLLRTQWLAFSGCVYTITFDFYFQVFYELQIPLAACKLGLVKLNPTLKNLLLICSKSF